MSTRSKMSLVFAACVGVLFLGSQPASAMSHEEEKQRSLYDRLGGLAPISVVVDDFIDTMIPDPFLNRNPAIDEARRRVPAPYLKYQVTALVCQETGGPCQYTGRNMKDSHVHLNITEEEWDRMVVIFKDVLARHRVPVPEQGELLDIVAATKDDIVAEAGASSKNVR